VRKQAARQTALAHLHVTNTRTANNDTRSFLSAGNALEGTHLITRFSTACCPLKQHFIVFFSLTLVIANKHLNSRSHGSAIDGPIHDYVTSSFPS
jgi:hypothetical protein